MYHTYINCVSNTAVRVRRASHLSYQLCSVSDQFYIYLVMFIGKNMNDCFENSIFLPLSFLSEIDDFHHHVSRRNKNDNSDFHQFFTLGQ